jgi:O-antigen/teichoic acid export membrane protein
MSLRHRMVTSAAWYAGTRAWMGLVSWGVGILLARLLMPQDYGLFAMALSVIVVLELLQNLGLGVAIIQRQDLTPRHLNAVFWIMLGLSIVIALVASGAAGVAARLYDEPRLIWVVRLLALSFVLDAVGLVPYNLLTKEIEFRGRSLAEAVAVVISALTALALAYQGFAFWALVVAHLVRSLVRNVGMLVASGWRPGFDVALAGMGSVVGFGLRVAGAQVIYTLSGTAQTAILGRFLGAVDLGYYSMASSLGKRNPLHKVSTSVISQLSLPVFSKIQKDDVQLRRHFLKVSKYLAALALPLQLGMALVALDLVLLLLTDKWLPIVTFVQVFAVGGILDIMPLPSTPLLTARGKSKMVVRVATVSAITMTAVYLVGVRWGLVGVATGWLVGFTVVRSFLLYLSLRELGLTVGRYLETLYSPILASLAMVAAVLSVRRFIPGGAGSVEHLLLTVAVGAVTYGVALLLLDRGFWIELRGIALELMPRRAPRKADA